ncbi:50S ribosomal protein L25 [Patescibacteria group bacterium]|nr:50S ribosomal protein L25 [Patescibacteria group bacterium]
MSIVLNSKLREDKNPRTLRAEGKIPAELYGPEIKNQTLVLDYNEFETAYDEAGESSLVTLKTPDGKDFNILIGEVQKDPVKDRFIHVDLRQVSMTEKIEAEATLVFVGEAPAVKELGGIFAPAQSTLVIKALPADLVNEIEVDISTLTTFDDKITVADIKLPQGVEAVDEPDVMIANITQQQEEEEVAPTAKEEAEGVESVEVEGKKEGEEGEEEKEE